jgi:histidine ammonia-lyase
MLGFTRYVVGIGAFLTALSCYAAVTFDGRSATPEAIARVANGESVDVPASALARVAKGHDVLLAAAADGQSIYGLTVGVGLNKDRQMVDAKGQLTPEVINASMRFNAALLHAHSAGVGPDMDIRDARAAMAVRLNQMLAGASGAQPAVAEMYAQLLNHGITPAIPANGSMGEADITLLAHVGLTMMGEGDVYYHGAKTGAAQALRAEGIQPITPWAKDALAILSSNAYTTGMASLALVDLAQLNRVAKLVYLVALEGLNGNVSPFLEASLALHPFPYVVRTGAALRSLLAGSSLFQRDDSRALQDPLSFRDAPYLLAELDRSFDQAHDQIMIQLNSSDDNPGVSVGVKPKSDLYQIKRSYLNRDGVTGAVLPNANFEPLPVILAFEDTGIAIAHNSLASAQQIIKLNDPRFTHLSRFLGTDNTLHAFGAMEKPPVVLAMENKVLAMPVSLEYLPVAGDIEDIATNAPQVVRRVRTEIDNQFQLLGIEMVSATQAVDIRKQHSQGFVTSPETGKFIMAFRQVVAFRDTDRPFTPDFRRAANFLEHYEE